VALALGPSLAGRAEEAEGIFALETLRVPGRPLEATLAPAPDGRPPDLVVAAVEGTPPEEERRLVLFPPPPAPRAPRPPASTVRAPGDAVFFDVAELGPGPGPELVFVSDTALRIVNPRSGESREIALSPPLGLPPQTRNLTRLACVADWQGDGRPAALLPTATGARLVPLAGGEARALPLPLVAEYETRANAPPPHSGSMSAFVVWPELVRADDDGDGRLDLFALSRFGVAVHRLGPGGLSLAPTRWIPLRPFTPAEELRPRTTGLFLRVRDLDGDGRADLVVSRAVGTLLHSHSSTEVYRNPGDGVRLPAAPDARLGVDSGLATVELEDLDGDGRVELVQGSIAFGVMQVVRVLTTRRAQIEVRVYRLAAPGIAGATLAWQGEISLALDLEQGRVSGLLPLVSGDWNGDGRKDLLVGTDRDTLAVYLGEATPQGPGFASRAIEQTAPVAGNALVADLDGDGLEDLVMWDTRDVSGAVHVLRNRGSLPGTPASLRAVGQPP